MILHSRFPGLSQAPSADAAERSSSRDVALLRTALPPHTLTPQARRALGWAGVSVFWAAITVLWANVVLFAWGNFVVRNAGTTLRIRGLGGACLS